MTLRRVIEKTRKLPSSWQSHEFYRGCILSSPYIKPLFTFAALDGDGRYRRTFPITRAGYYRLYYANCVPGTRVTMDVRIEIYNSNTDGSTGYLSVGEDPVTAVYSFFAVCYGVFLIAWLHHTHVRKCFSARPVHDVMSGLLAVLMLHCLFAAEDEHTRVIGTVHGWSAPFFALRLVKGAMLFSVVALLGAGWSLPEPFLPDIESVG